MTKICIICKKQPIPRDNTRSFHKFPVNQDMKLKWICAIGVSSITNNSRVYSDHFDSSAYHQTDGYTSLKRLLSTAVLSKEIHSSQNLVNNNTNTTQGQDTHNPKIVLQNKSHDVEYLHDNVIDDDTISNSNTTLNKSCDNECFYSNRLKDTINKSEVPLDADKTKKVNEKNSSTMENSNINLKRKRSANDTGSNVLTKKFRYLDGSQTNCISREDFVSDEAWNRFLKLMIHKNKPIAAAQKKCFRRKKKINNFKELINKLEERETSVVVEY